MHRRLGTLAVVLGLCALVACGNKKKQSSAPPPEVTGLAAVPATAQAVIAGDVAKLAASPIVTRAAEQLLLRDPVLAERWAGMQDHCTLDLTAQVKHVMLALGPPAGPAGSGPVLMVATGTLSETDLVACIPKIVGTGAGGLTTKSVGGRSLYQVKDGNRIVYFAFGRPDTVVLGTNEAWVVEALGPGNKALDNPELQRWLGLTDQKAPLWAVGRIDKRVGDGLVAASQGRLAKQPAAVVASVDPRNGATLDVGVVMGADDAAKQLESYAKTELAVIAMAAQLKSLGSMIGKVTITAEGPVVRFRAALTQPEVNQLLSVLDEKPAPEQGTPPAGK